MKPINLRIAEELGVREQQVATAISLLERRSDRGGLLRAQRRGADR